MSLIFTPGHLNGLISSDYVVFPADQEHVDYFKVDDSRNWYNNASNIFSPGISGVYIIAPQISTTNDVGFTPSVNHIFEVKKNGTTVIATFYVHPPYSSSMSLICVEYLNETDYLTFEFTNGVPTHPIVVNKFNTLLTAILKDPDYYSDPPKPACGLIKLALPSNQSIPSEVLTNVALTTNDNYRNAFNNETNRFQPDIPGYYFININILWGACANVTSRRSLEVWINGAFYDKYMIPSRLFQDTINLTRLIYLNGVNDYLEIKAFQATGNTVILNSINSYGNILLFTADEYSSGSISQPVTRTVTAEFSNVAMPWNPNVVSWFVPIINNDGWFDPSIGVFTPTMEGIYLVTSSFYSEEETLPGPYGSLASMYVYKNVYSINNLVATGTRTSYRTQNNLRSISIFGTVYMNGTTDKLTIAYFNSPGDYLANGKISFSLVTNNTMTGASI